MWAIPSSTPQQQQRPASGWSDSRRGRRDSDFDDNDGFGALDESQRRPARPARRSNSPSVDRSSGSGWDDFGVDNDSSFEPYVYDKPTSGDGGRRGRDFGSRERSSRDRGNRAKYGGRGDNRPRGENVGRGRGGGRGSDRGGRRFDRGGGNEREDSKSNMQSSLNTVKINLKQIENAGYEHLYGMAPVLNALKANVRDFSLPQDDEESEEKEVLELQRRLSAVDGASWEDQDDVTEIRPAKTNIKPEAKLAPCLFVQEGTLDNTKRSFRSAVKNEASSEILSLAQQIKSLNVVEVDKGVLNTLCGNRPHQGFVLRCGGLEFTPLKSGSLPLPKAGDRLPSLWLALDEVVDPQNLGALLRSAFFLGGGPGVIEEDPDKSMTDRGIGAGNGVGILVCSKNSSPLTPTVSAASAGALEFMTVYSTSNLPKLLNKARDDGWRVLGAAAEAPDTDSNSKRKGHNTRRSIVSNDWDLVEDDDDENDHNSNIVEYNTAPLPLQELEQKCYDLREVEAGPPTVLVLGSEGSGLRTLVGRACTGFVKIPGGLNVDSDTQAGVDSLNVSFPSGGVKNEFPVPTKS
ncbi:hypothetical protein HJC23_012007 [Cyclotella cryptica]|uniref:RNA 2-O ribose methyltransferase substrate binding domain-containing protein n=1 Tax=Cyclotella cryptica TaxID=29204 RepID=A0ABD3QQJ8_9STRA